MNSPEALLTRLNRIQRNALIVGAVGVVLCVLGVLVNPVQFFQSYLFAYLFWLGIALGCFVWMLIYHLTGGRWGVAVRRLLETSATMTLLMALLFIPFFFGMSELYAWARPEVVAADTVLQHKQPYLNVPFFFIRAAVYFVIWVGIALLLNKWSRDQDAESDTFRKARRRRQFSGPALAIYGLTITFSAIDWLMSLEPHWFSSIFGVLVAAGQVLVALAFVIVVLVLLANWEPLTDIVTARLLNDLGNLLLAAVLFWGYIAFIQYLIIWSGNIPEEVIWYLRRLEGGWSWVALFLVLFHFALPFAVLLSGRVKRRARLLAGVAGVLLIAHLINLFWMVAPVFHTRGFHMHWLDLAVPLAIGGVWIALFIWRLAQQPLLSRHEVYGQEVHSHE